MYWWNTQALVEDLKAQRLSQRERMKYLLGFLVLSVLLSELMLWIGTKPSLLGLIAVPGMVAITVGGVLWCYQANRQGDNVEFLDRFVCLSWPVTIRLLALFSVLYLIYSIAGSLIFGEQFDVFSEHTTIVDILFDCIFEFLFYWRMRARILEVSRK